MTGCFTLQIKGFPLFLPTVSSAIYNEEDSHHLWKFSVGAVLEGTIKSITKFGRVRHLARRAVRFGPHL